jgi:hypothetical protein
MRITAKELISVMSELPPDCLVYAEYVTPRCVRVVLEADGDGEYELSSDFPGVSNVDVSDEAISEAIVRFSMGRERTGEAWSLLNGLCDEVMRIASAHKAKGGNK